MRSDRGPEIQLVGPERKLGGSSAGAEAELWGSTAGADLVPAALQAGFLVPAVGNWLASDGYLQEEAGARKTETMANEVAGATAGAQPSQPAVGWNSEKGWIGSVCRRVKNVLMCRAD